MPPPAPLADVPDAPLGFGLSAEQVSILYQQYQDRLPCPEEAICGRARKLPVGLVDCQLHGSINEMRCSFVVSATPYGTRDIYRCEGLFRRDDRGWHLAHMLESCQMASWRASQ